MKGSVLLLLGFLFLAGCSQEAPLIREQFSQINLRDDTVIGDTYEQLSVFIHVEDEDGYEDLEYLYVIQDESELFWKMDAEGWEHRERDGESWIGSNDIIMSDFGPFPEGSYRVIVIDKAGERMETEIYVRKTGPVPPFALVEEGEGSITLSGTARKYSVWMYRDREYVGSRTLSAGTITSADLENDKITHIFLYYYDNEGGRGVIRGPYWL